MNYKKIYDNIILNRLENNYDGYTEKHHILPKSLGGKDSSNNLVKLSAREHFICHYLLTKIYKNETFEWYKMNHAFMIMKMSSEFQKRYFNSKLYESKRKNFSKVMSENSKGLKNSQFGKIWIYNILKEKSFRIKKEEFPEYEKLGWLKGRKMNFNLKSATSKEKIDNKIKREKKKIQAVIKKLISKIKLDKKLKDEKQKFVDLFDKYINGNFKSIRDFVKNYDYYNKSHVSLTKSFKKHISNYNDLIKQGKCFIPE